LVKKRGEARTEAVKGHKRAFFDAGQSFGDLKS